MSVFSNLRLVCCCCLPVYWTTLFDRIDQQDTGVIYMMPPECSMRTMLPSASYASLLSQNFPVISEAIPKRPSYHEYTGVHEVVLLLLHCCCCCFVVVHSRSLTTTLQQSEQDHTHADVDIFIFFHFFRREKVTDGTIGWFGAVFSPGNGKGGWAGGFLKP